MNVRGAEGVAIHELEQLPSRAVVGDCEEDKSAWSERPSEILRAYWGREWAA